MADYEDNLRIANDIPPRKSYLEISKDLMGFGAVLLSIIYTAGFLIESIFLLKYGVSDITLLKPRYISIGITFIFFASLVIVPTFFITRHIFGAIKTIKKNETKISMNCDKAFQVFGGPVIILIMIFGATGQLIQLASYTSFDEFHRGTTRNQIPEGLQLLWNLSFSWFAQLMAIGLLVYFSSAISKMLVGTFKFKGSQQSQAELYKVSKTLALSNGSAELAQVAVSFFLTFSLALISASFAYSERIYPRINPAFGGGNFPYLQFVFDAKDAQIFNQLGITQHPKDSKSLPVKLLAQNEKNYVVLLDKQPDNRVVLVSKDIIKGIISVMYKDHSE